MKITLTFMMLLFLILSIIFSHTEAQGPMFKPDPRLSPQLPPNATLRYGDMALTEEQEWAMKLGPISFNAIIGEKYRWKDAIIPYKIDCSVDNFPRSVAAIKAAIAQWERKTCIRFVPYTNQEFHLTFFRNTHCWGNVGQVSWSHISVGPGCDYEHVMAHEIGHVVGLYHEQNRKDRDDWVEIFWDNIGQFKDAFDIVENTDPLGIQYDYESIMHYPWSAFSVNGKDTMRPKKPTHGKVPYIEISKDDVRLVSRMYKCPEVMKKRAEKEQEEKRHRVSRIPHPKFRDVVPNKFNRWDCIDKYEGCEEWAKNGECVSNPTVRNFCKRSCIAATCFGSDCRDGHEDCPDWAEMGHCKFVDSVQADCQKSCNPTCKGKPTPKPSPTSVKPTHRRPTTINTRTHPTLPPSPPTTEDPHHNHTKWYTWPNRNYLGTGSRCVDWYDKCPEWADQGECERNEGWMLENCKKSCPKARCDPTILKPPGQCVEPLGLSVDLEGSYQIPDSAMTATSTFSPGGGWHGAARNARLYFEDDYNDLRIGCWCAADRDPGQHVQVDLGQLRTISYIATQGRPNFFERTSKFKIEYSEDGRNFQPFQEKGKDREFWGNCDHATPVLNKFEGQMQARYVRYIPLESNYPCVRMEFFGC